MKKNLLGWSLMLAAMLAGPQGVAQDVDLTNLIVNNDFEYIAEGTPLTADTWKPGDANKNQGITEFYGWKCDLSNLGNTSQGINKDFDKFQHGTYGAWIGGDCVLPEMWEFYQIIDKDKLDAGTYKVQCLLAAKTTKRTSQRIFANQNVQYFSTEAWYEKNQTESEIATFAGHVPETGSDDDLDKVLKEMVVYTTIGENDSLKIGIRTGGIKGDGTAAPKASPMWGWLKFDYFRLTKIDPVTAANCKMKNIELSVGTLEFDPAIKEYNVSLPKGTAEVTLTCEPEVKDAPIKGAGAVSFAESATGTSVIVITSLDGTSSETYTINYTVEDWSAVDAVAAEQVNCFVNNGMLTVEGTDAYEVYSINGVKVAEVHDNINSVVALNQGIYLVKTPNLGVYKVAVK